MLTDIFAYRYADVPMWDTFEERDRRFLVQAFKIVTEQLYVPFVNGTKIAWAEPKWKLLHDRLSTELGLHELYKRHYSHTQVGYYSWDFVCKQFVCADYDVNVLPDRFIKERISFIELAFRQRSEDVQATNNDLPRQLMIAKSRSDPAAGVKADNKALNDEFRASIDELNTRLRQAGYSLNYHNGFIQISADEKVEEQIETPFWALVADLKWQNVDTDMKEALDLRDSGSRDPSWYAAKALESTIKIISKEKGWTHGGEKGASNFIDNLSAKKNGQYIDAWESESMKQFFKHVRNPFGHGAGSDQMPKLNDQQTNWAIEFCMTWVRSLIERM